MSISLKMSFCHYYYFRIGCIKIKLTHCASFLLKMNMSSTLLSSLESTSKYLYRYGGVLLIGFGTIGCSLNILVFNQKKFCKNPCSIYFLIANIFNLLFIHSLLLMTTLESGFNIHLNVKSLLLCRLCFYTSLISNVLSTYCLLLASFNRALVTSPQYFVQNRAGQHFAYIHILFGTIFWMIFHSPALIFTNITSYNRNISICFYQTGFYLTFIGYYSIVKESLSSLLLITLGVWTINNLRRSRRSSYFAISFRKTSIPRSITRPNDRQFIFMVLTDIIIFSVCSSSAAIFLTHQQLTQYQEKSFEKIQLDLFLKHVAIFCLHIPFCISCYTNVLVSRAYRQAVRNIFSNSNESHLHPIH